MYKKLLIFIIVLSLSASSLVFGLLYFDSTKKDDLSVNTEDTTAEEEVPKDYKNIILMIGDGMGFEHVQAAESYQHSKGSALFLSHAPIQKFVRTFPENGVVTDSAAAATAIATGEKVDNSVLSLKDGGELETILEIAQDKNMSTGLVTTKYINDATPAAFATHNIDRDNYREIFEDMFVDTQPDVLFGGTPRGVSIGDYSLDYTQIDDVSLSNSNSDKVFGLFDFTVESHPGLSELTNYSLNKLSKDSDGFFLMIEGARIDLASHSNDTEYMIDQMVDFDNAVKSAYEFSVNSGDTLLIVTADHETGDLEYKGGIDTDGLPIVEWGSTSHTSRYVPLLSWENVFSGELIIDNTQIFDLMYQEIKD